MQIITIEVEKERLFIDGKNVRFIVISLAYLSIIYLICSQENQMDSYDIHSSADRPTKESLIQIDQRNGKPRRWEQKLVQIKTMEGEFSVTMWASGTSDDEFSNSDNNPEELDYLPENGTDNDNADTTFPADVQAISDNQLQLHKSESVLQQQQQLFFHQQQEQFLNQLTLPLSQQKSSQECQLALDNPALQNDNDCEPTTEAAAIGNISFALCKNN